MLGSRTTLPATPTLGSGSAARPVLLVTFQLPIRSEAAVVAVDSAVEAGQPLIVANLIGGLFFPSLAGPPPTPVVVPEVEDSLRVPAELAASLGIPAERLRVLSPRPIDALVELVSERAAGLLVLGADRSKLHRRFRSKLDRRLRDQTSCFVWPPL